MSTNVSTSEPRRALLLNIDGKTFELRDPVVSGRQILDLAGKRPASEFVVLQYLSSGLLEEIRLEETVDLRERGTLVGADPDRLLVVLKGIWGTLPEVRAMTNSTEQVRLLQRVVTMCIKEYYSA